MEFQVLIANFTRFDQMYLIRTISQDQIKTRSEPNQEQSNHFKLVEKAISRPTRALKNCYRCVISSEKKALTKFFDFCPSEVGSKEHFPAKQ